MRVRYSSIGVLALACVLLQANVLADSMGTVFTYQGRIEDAGGPITGTCDLAFSLWDAESGGLEVGNSPQPAPGTSVNDGLFTVTLDFGDEAFNGEARWLEMEVCCPSGSCSLETLTPRQRLTPAPHALALPGLSTQQTASSHNLIGGYTGNSVDAAVEAGTVGGGGVPGFPNRVFDSSGTIGGGDNNTAGSDDGDPGTATNATVCGGGENTATAHFATTGGGWLNNATGETSVVSGGQANNASGPASTIGGGENNYAYDYSSTVAGGTGNAAGTDDGDYFSAHRSTVGGGENNTASAYASTVAGGSSNTSSSDGATVSGGMFNAATGGTSVVGGGVNNTATGGNATVPGGESNTASHNSFAAGTRAQANHVGTFVWSDITTPEGNFFASTGDNQFLIKSDGGVGVNTNNPLASLHIGDTGRFGWDGIMFPDGTVQTSAYTGSASGGFWSTSGNDIYSANAGNVGIGTATPDPRRKLEVVTSAWRVCVGGSAPGVACDYDVDCAPGTCETASAVAGISTTANWAIGVHGQAAGQGLGVFGETEDGAGVRGWATSTTAANVGVSGFTASPTGHGVQGMQYADTGSMAAVDGVTFSTGPNGTGVGGLAASTTGTTYGVRGQADSSEGTGVIGLAASAIGTTYGVQGHADSPDGTGVLGLAISPTGTTYGVKGEAASPGGIGVHGEAPLYGVTGAAESIGVYGAASDAFVGIGVKGEGALYGVRAISTSTSGDGVHANTLGQGRGVYGETQDGVGVSGYAAGTAGNNIGVRGASESPDGYAGYFLGRGYFSGNVGIGTNAPTEKLQVEGDARVTADMSVDGKLGIGTNAPLQKLQVESNSGNTFAFLNSTDPGGASSGVIFGFDGSKKYAIGVARNRNLLEFGTTSPVTNAGLRMDDAFHVGIGSFGTLVPINTLDVIGRVAIGLPFATHSTAPDNGLIVGGNVGIGTDAPLAPLQVEGTELGPAINASNQISSVGQRFPELTTRYGIWAAASDDDATTPQVGVFGLAADGEHKNYGLYGQAESLTANENYGVFGRVYGVSSCYGGYFKSNSVDGGAGVYAETSADNANGVHAKVTGTNSYAGYFEGGKNYFEGNVGIGTTLPNGKLDVNGAIYQRGGLLHADYVFEPDYSLESIDEHSRVMWSEKHLPAMPGARKDAEGKEIVEIGSHRRGIVEELEKAHIYIEQLHKRDKEKEAILASQREQIALLAARLAALEEMVRNSDSNEDGDTQ